MKGLWLSTLLKLSSHIHTQKQKLFSARSLGALLIGTYLLILELIMSVLASPIGVFLKLDKEDGIDGQTMLRFQARRKLTLNVVVAVAVLYLGQFLVGAAIGLLIVQPASVDASIQTWSFDQPGEYIYDASKIQLVDGIAIKPPQYGETECEASIQPISSLKVSDLYSWNTFQVSSINAQGRVLIQLSDDNGATWQYWNGEAWTLATVNQLNTVEQVSESIQFFPTTNKSITFKVVLTESCEDQMQLSNIGLGYTTNEEHQASILEGLTSGGESNVSMALSAWVNFTTMPETDGHIVGESGYEIGIDPISNHFYFTDEEGVVNAVSDSPVSLGEWYHVAGTYDGIELKLYVNGAIADSKTLVASEWGPILEVNTVDNSALDAVIMSETVSTVIPTDDEIALDYLNGVNTPPLVGLNSVSQLAEGLQFGIVITDLESSFVNIEQFEISATGDFAGEQFEPTFSSESEVQALLRALSASRQGSIHNLVWDVFEDIDVSGLTEIFIRLQASDGIEASEVFTSDSIPVDFFVPKVSINEVVYLDGVGYTIGFELEDNTTGPFGYSVQYSRDSEVWESIDVSEMTANDIHLGSNVVVWNSAEAIEGVSIRLVIQDQIGNTGESTFPKPQVLGEETDQADDSDPVDIVETEIIIPSGEYQESIVETVQEQPQVLKTLAEAKESKLLPVPQVDSVNFNTVTNEIVIQGTGMPNSKIVLFINSPQALMYSMTVDGEGKWNFVHSQAEFELESGEHSVYGITLDEESETKSAAGEGQGFVINESKLNNILSKFDVSTTALTVFIIFLALAVFVVKSKHMKYQSSK